MRPVTLTPGPHARGHGEAACRGDLYRMVERESRLMVNFHLDLSFTDFHKWQTGWIDAEEQEQICSSVVRWIDAHPDWLGGRIGGEIDSFQRETALSVARRAARSELDKAHRRLSRSVLIRKLIKAINEPHVDERARADGRRVIAALRNRQPESKIPGETP